MPGKIMDSQNDLVFEPVAAFAENPGNGALAK
ncbi:hypothetical protein BJAS_P4573 [Bathymodiolus japonicus methanotrophic gill symbiont]|nr:hypothetical protein BJAS_P4573 [Bathymodiolus japonicus methanotrophic gill symbiont]